MWQHMLPTAHSPASVVRVPRAKSRCADTQCPLRAGDRGQWLLFLRSSMDHQRHRRPRSNSWAHGWATLCPTAPNSTAPPRPVSALTASPPPVSASSARAMPPPAAASRVNPTLASRSSAPSPVAANSNAALLGLGTAGPGVQGQSTGGHGTVGTITTSDGTHAAVLGYVQPGGNAFGVRGSIPSGCDGLGGGVRWRCDGQRGAAGLRLPEECGGQAPEGQHLPSLVLRGSAGELVRGLWRGTLAGDKADITLDPDFAALVHVDDYHVFVTAHGPQHLHIAQQSATGFSVVATAIGGAAGGPKPAEGGGTFAWRVVAKRKDIAGERLAKVPPPPPLQPVKAFTVPETPTAKPPTTKP